LTQLDARRLREEAEWDALQEGPVPLIRVGTATCGRSAGSLESLEVLRREADDRGLECNIVEVGCIGLCYAEPLVSITKPSQPAICYGEVTPRLAGQLVHGYLADGDPLADHALGTIGPGSIEGIPDLFDTPVLRPQVRRVLRN
jgi:NADH-quinone oxidoreductase subunit F